MVREEDRDETYEKRRQGEETGEVMSVMREDEQRTDRGARRMVGHRGQTGLVPVPLCVYERESAPMSFCVCVPASLYWLI